LTMCLRIIKTNINSITGLKGLLRFL